MTRAGSPIAPTTKAMRLMRPNTQYAGYWEFPVNWEMTDQAVVTVMAKNEPTKLRMWASAHSQLPMP